MDYVSPYLLAPHLPSPAERKACLSPWEVVHDDILSLSEKRATLERLEKDALAAITMEDEAAPVKDAKSPTRLLEEVRLAKRSLYRAS